jgi:hypothetical protein
LTVKEPPYCGALAAVVVTEVVVVITVEVEDVFLVQEDRTSDGAITAIMSRLNPTLTQNFFLLTFFSLVLLFLCFYIEPGSCP